MRYNGYQQNVSKQNFMFEKSRGVANSAATEAAY
jgi:hypothetical protein